MISIKPELANIKNKMVLVHEDSEMLGSDESIFRNTTGNKMKVKLLMNNNTVEVDTPTSKHFIEFGSPKWIVIVSTLTVRGPY